MRRIMFLAVLSLVLCGCAIISNDSKVTKSSNETDIQIKFQTSTSNPNTTKLQEASSRPVSDISSPEKDMVNCSKFEVVNKDIDVKKIMKLLYEKKSLNSFKRGKTGEWVSQIDGVYHTWQKIENGGVIYFSDRKIEKTDKDKARRAAEDFIKRFCSNFNLSFIKESEKTDEDGCYTFCYAQTCEGIRVMGNKTVALPNNDEKSIHGSYIEVTIDGAGINSLFLQQAFDVKKTVKSYQAEKDFIVRDKILETAKKYYKKLYTDLKDKAEMEIQDIQIIYMPYIEGNVQYLIPVYDLSIKEESRKEPICMLMDTVTAYVYYAQ